MGFIKIPYNGNDTELYKLGDKILYYKDMRNFSTVQNRVNANIETQVKCPGVRTYSLIDDKYIATNNFSESVEYYIEDGTLEVDCPACGERSQKPGFLIGDDNKYYPCPRCKGKGTLIAATTPAPIVNININQISLEEDGYIVEYKVVPGDETLSTTLLSVEYETFLDATTLISILTYWVELIFNLKQYYKSTEKVSDVFFNEFLDEYIDHIKELQVLIKNTNIEDIKINSKDLEKLSSYGFNITFSQDKMTTKNNIDLAITQFIQDV